jgi:GTPase SAR1 family protein
MENRLTQSHRHSVSTSKRWSTKVSHQFSSLIAILCFLHLPGYTLNLWDVGGQKSLRSYWRNYFESTDGLVWVVDSADRMRLDACREELNILLLEERLAGATLLVLANKQDLPGALSAQEIKDAS